MTSHETKSRAETWDAYERIRQAELILDTVSDLEDWTRKRASVFLSCAAQEIEREFGERARWAFSKFTYADGGEELHVVIDVGAAEPRQAGEALDRLCDSWWDRPSAELGIGIYPVLGYVAPAEGGCTCER